MRSNALVALLSLTQLALGAPIPVVLVQDLGPPQTVGAHPPAPIALKAGQTLADVFRDREDSAAQLPFDNRPVTPPSTVTPSVALAAPQPVTTTYLLSLSMRRPRPAAPLVEIEEFVMVDGEEAIAISQSDMGAPRPCRFAHSQRRHGDLLAVSLVAIFLFVVVVVETWDAARQRLVPLLRAGPEDRALTVRRRRNSSSRQGPICLETDEHPSEKKRLLSIQAGSPMDELETTKTQAEVAL